MQQELQDKLFQKYPDIFVQRHLSNDKTSMCYGIQCPDSFYDIIDALCQCIQSHVKYKKSEFEKDSRGWLGSLHPPNIKTVKNCEALQVKTKFGQLRFYTTGTDDYIRGAIAVAEMLSRKIK